MSRSDDGLRPIAVKMMKGPHWQPIETGSTGSGVPDLNGCWDGVEVWLELKAVRAGIKVKSLTAFQIGWIWKRVKRGGNVWIAVRVHKERSVRIEPTDHIQVYHGSAVNLLAQYGIEARPSMKFPTGDQGGWFHFQQLMFNRTI